MAPGVCLSIHSSIQALLCGFKRLCALQSDVSAGACHHHQSSLTSVLSRAAAQHVLSEPGVEDKFIRSSAPSQGSLDPDTILFFMKKMSLFSFLGCLYIYF